MVSDIKTAISVAIDAEYPSIPIAIDNTPQDFNPPYFYIKTLNVWQGQIVGLRYYRRDSFDVHYFPSESTEISSEMENVAETLINALERIGVNGEYRSRPIRFEVIEDVLHVFVSYNYTAIKEADPVDLMTEVDINTPY